MSASVHPSEIDYALDEDHLVIFVNTILVDPIRVQPTPIRTISPSAAQRHSHPQIPTPLPNSLLGSTLQPPLILQMVHPLPNGFTISSTLRHRLLPVPLPDSDPIDEVTLLGFVTETTSFIRSRRTRGSVDNGELSVLPASDS